MNQQEFVAKLKEMVCHSDWHRRYYTALARKYNRIDYWIKASLGAVGVLGAVLAGTNHFRILGAIMAGASAFFIGTILPNFQWDSIVCGFKTEEQEWTRILYGYEGLLRMSQIFDKDEMLAQEFQKVEELRKAAALNERHLPHNQKLLDRLEEEVRKFYGLDEPGAK